MPIPSKKKLVTPLITIVGFWVVYLSSFQFSSLALSCIFLVLGVFQAVIVFKNLLDITEWNTSSLILPMVSGIVGSGIFLYLSRGSLPSLNIVNGSFLALLIGVVFFAPIVFFFQTVVVQWKFWMIYLSGNYHKLVMFKDKIQGWVWVIQKDGLYFYSKDDGYLYGPHIDMAYTFPMKENARMFLIWEKLNYVEPN